MNRNRGGRTNRRALRVGIGIAIAIISAVIKLANQPTAGPDEEVVDAQAGLKNEKAIKLLEVGNFAAAEKLLKEALRIEPDSWTINFNLASAQLAQGNPTDAFRHAKKALAVRPNDADILEFTTWLAFSSGDSELAYDCSKQLLAVRPALQQHLDHQTLCSIIGGAVWEECQRVYAERAASHGDSGEALFLHGRICEDPDLALRQLERANQVSPKTEMIRVALADAQVSAGAPEGAARTIKDVDPCLRADPSDGPIGAVVALARGDAKLALEITKRALAREDELDPTPIFHQRFEANLLLERWDAARRTIERMAQANPEAPLGLLRIRLLDREGHHDAALKELDRIASEFASNMLYSALLATERVIIQWNRGDLDQALAAAKAEVASIEGTRFRVWQAQLQLLRGKKGEARALLESVSEGKLEQFPQGEPAAMLLLGKLGDEAFLDRARREFASMMNDAWFAVGLKYEQQGNVAKAKEAYEQAVVTSRGREFPFVPAERAVKRLSR